MGGRHTHLDYFSTGIPALSESSQPRLSLTAMPSLPPPATQRPIEQTDRIVPGYDADC